MVVVDTNVLVYAKNEASPHHAGADAWLEAALAGATTVGLPWLVLVAFLRISTDDKILTAPVSPAAAATQVERWLTCPAARTLDPGPRHMTILTDLLTRTHASANLASDAHLAALAIEHRATMVSFDRDFGRFPGLKTLVPS